VTVVKKLNVSRACGVCNRTLLLGERTTRYSPEEGEWVDVCALCTDEATLNGWIREGSPTTPLVAEARRRRRLLPSLGLLEGRRPAQEPVSAEPVLRRLTPHEQAMLDAAGAFNESPYQRTVAGIVKSLGEPRVSFLLLSGTNAEVVVTVAWDISWYQYRVSLGQGLAVRLAERGYELEELDDRFQVWNGTLDASGRAMPDIPRV
jgi:hypothetical protein